MTLKEKFRPHARYWDCYNDEPLKYDHENKCVKIAEDFAIEFAEWLVTDWHNDERWSIINDRKELLEIYKKEKGL